MTYFLLPPTVPYHFPANSGNQDPPFRTGEVFTIGYDSAGIKLRRTVNLPDGQDITVGFIKMFFTTQYVDFSNILQRTPFIPGRADLPPPTKVKPARWGTILIPQIQRRSK